MSRFLSRLPKIEDFQTKGFLIVGVADPVAESIQRIFELTTVFFKRSKSEKLADSLCELNEGWRDLGGEFSINPDRPDLHESFWVTPRHADRARAAYSNVGLKLYDEMRNCISMLSDVERTVTKELIAFVAPTQNEPSFSCSRDSDMQALYYQPSVHERECLQEPHDDSLYMTFLKANRPGLEWQSKSGDYHAVELDKDELIVMPGEILALLTGYKIKPLIHRVVRHRDQIERLALGYFTYPNLDANSTLAPWVANESNDGIDIMARAINNQSQYLIDPPRKTVDSMPRNSISEGS
jgi:isopenicillin N synthase-like dioxygenase